MANNNLYTQVLLRSDLGHYMTCWVEDKFARKGKRVQSTEGYRIVWTVMDCYATWPKAKLDDQQVETNRFKEVLR